MTKIFWAKTSPFSILHFLELVTTDWPTDFARFKAAVADKYVRFHKIPLSLWYPEKPKSITEFHDWILSTTYYAFYAFNWKI